MNEIRFRKRVILIRRLRIALMALALVPFCMLLLPQFARQPLLWDVTQDDVHELLQKREARRNDKRYQVLWPLIEPLQVAFERLAQDLKDRLESNIRGIDGPYVDDQIGVIEIRIRDRGEIALYVLGYYALEEESPLKRALALVVIREYFPKKNGAFFANRLVYSPDPVVAEIARQITGGRYRVSGLKARLKSDYFKNPSGMQKDR